MNIVITGRGDGATVHKLLLREITVTLCLKILALIALFYIFFAPADRPQINADTVDRHLFSSQSGSKP